MARVVILGGTGRTGRQLLAQLRARGDTTVAVFRDASKRAEIKKLGAETVVLDLGDATVAQLASYMSGADAVIFAAGTRDDEDNVDQIDRDGSIKSAAAALQSGVKRFIQISAMGVRTGFPADLDGQMRAYYEAKRAADLHLATTTLDWTILEPGRLNDGPGTGRVHVAEAIGEFGSISRADVAAAAIAALDLPATIHRAFEIIEGQNEPANAFSQATHAPP